MSVKLVPVAVKGVRTISACRTFLNSPDAFTIGEVIAL